MCFCDIQAGIGMKIRRICTILTVMLGVVAGCGERDSACDSSVDQPKCGNNGHIRWVCTDNEWQSEPCGEGALCVYTAEGPSCEEDKPVEVTCGTAGAKFCTVGGFMQICQKDGSWMYRACGENQKCQAGDCVDTSTKPTKPDIQLEGILRQQCSKDGKSIETVDSDGKITSQTCKALVGFETQCQTYQSGHVGCKIPDVCDDVFSENGTCVGDDILLACDTDYLFGKPFMQSCSSVDQICRKNHEKSSCMSRCETPDNTAISCSKHNDLEMASRCISIGTDNVTESAVALCLDEHTSVSCEEGDTKEHSCAAGETCISSLGVCAKSCQSSEAGQVICDSDGDMYQCQAVADIYAYVSVGKRHCLDDVLVSCGKSENGIYEVKETNCRTYMHNGELLECSCQVDYQYPDMDVCVPVVHGDPCNGELNSGHCEGNELVYCVEEDDALVRSDCSSDLDGFVSCSEYSGFADCRKPCKTSGNATCTVSPDGSSYYVNLCAPDDKDGTLTLIEGDSICLGNTLYQCNLVGNTVKTDCSLNGGACEINRCVYPACPQVDEPICLADNAMLSCQMDTDGMMLGVTMQTVSCDANGNCIKCENGVVTQF